MDFSSLQLVDDNVGPGARSKYICIAEGMPQAEPIRVKDYQEDSQSFTSLGKASERHLESAGSSRPEFTRMEDKITRHLSIAGDVCTSEKYIRLGCTIPWTHAIPLARTNQ